MILNYPCLQFGQAFVLKGNMELLERREDTNRQQNYRLIWPWRPKRVDRTTTAE